MDHSETQAGHKTQNEDKQNKKIKNKQTVPTKRLKVNWGARKS